MMRFWDADAIEIALPFPLLIDALDNAFRCTATTPLRTRHEIERPFGRKNDLLLMPSWGVSNFMGVKTVMVCPENAVRNINTVQSTYLLMDADTGEALGLLDGNALTRRRTAAASALASRYLAKADAHRLLMVGAGALAPHLIAAHTAVRPIRTVEIWARNSEKARACARNVEQMTGLDVRINGNLCEAVRRADIISCATFSTDPLILGDWLCDGQHLDLVGGFTPEMRECDDAAVAKSAVYVDSLQAAAVEAGDILAPIQSGVITASDIRGDLSGLSTGKVSIRRDDLEITLFKSVGIGLEDLAAAALVIANASSSASVKGL